MIMSSSIWFNTTFHIFWKGKIDQLWNWLVFGVKTWVPVPTGRCRVRWAWSAGRGAWTNKRDAIYSIAKTARLGRRADLARLVRSCSRRRICVTLTLLRYQSMHHYVPAGVLTPRPCAFFHRSLYLSAQLSGLRIAESQIRHGSVLPR